MRSIVAAIQPPEMRECIGRHREEDFSEQSGLLQRGQEYTGSQNAHINPPFAMACRWDHG